MTYFSNIGRTLLDDADRNMGLYETFVDRTPDRLNLARIQVEAAYDKGVNVDSQLLRLVNNYRTLELPLDLSCSLVSDSKLLAQKRSKIK